MKILSGALMLTLAGCSSMQSGQMLDEKGNLTLEVDCRAGSSVRLQVDRSQDEQSHGETTEVDPSRLKGGGYVR